MAELIDFVSIEEKVEALHDSFESAAPFKHVVIDGFLTQDAVEEVVALGMHETPIANENSSDFVFAKNKMEAPDIANINETMKQLKAELISSRFRAFLSNLAGYELFVDEKFVGGGLHQGGAGSYLDMHADFSRHPESRNWIRELNILLYLNPDYDPEWGGALKLVHSKTRASTQIAPLLNRAVIMLTKEHTIHGYDPIAFPDGRFRTSIAAYAYRLERGNESIPFRTTQWQPAGAGKRILARVMSPLVVLKQGLLGSRTVKRAASKRKSP